jgi:hypothetical protein
MYIYLNDIKKKLPYLVGINNKINIPEAENTSNDTFSALFLSTLHRDVAGLAALLMFRLRGVMVTV